MDFRSFRDIDWQLLFIRTYTWLSTMYALVSSQTVKSVKYLAASFNPEIYVLYRGGSVPVRASDYSKDVAGTSNVDFYYNRETKTLSKTVETSHIPRTLNIEGASIYHGDVCLYDLTDFFDSTRFAGNQEVPSLEQWVGVWELENSIYLDREKDFQLHVEFLGAGREEFSLWGLRGGRGGDRWKELTSTVPRLHRQTARALMGPDCSCASTATQPIDTTSEETAPCEAPAPRTMTWDENTATWREVTDLSGSLVDLSGNTTTGIEESAVQPIEPPSEN